MMFNAFRGKIFLEFVRCKGRATVWYYVIWYAIQAKKLFERRNNISGQGTARKLYVRIFHALVDHCKYILTIQEWAQKSRLCKLRYQLMSIM